MPLQQTPFYRSHLADLHQVLLAHEITRSYLTGTRVRFDGVELGPTNSFDFAFGTLSTLEFVHLFSVFDGSRVHGQAERRPGRDDAPPGMYFTVINAKVIQAGHKNRSGIFSEETGTVGLFIEGMSGEDALFPLQVAAGAKGGIVVTASLIPQVWQQIFMLAGSGQLREALALHRELNPMINLIFAETNPGPMKAVMDVIGVNAPTLLPTLVAPNAELAAIQQRQRHSGASVIEDIALHRAVETRCNGQILLARSLKALDRSDPSSTRSHRRRSARCARRRTCVQSGTPACTRVRRRLAGIG